MRFTATQSAENRVISARYAHAREMKAYETLDEETPPDR